MNDCKHLNFSAQVNVMRLHPDGEPENITGYSADITIQCLECKQPFEFVGVGVGYRHDMPTTNVECNEMHLPTIPATGIFKVPTKLSYSIPPNNKEKKRSDA